LDHQLSNGAHILDALFASQDNYYRARAQGRTVRTRPYNEMCHELGRKEASKELGMYQQVTYRTRYMGRGLQTRK